MPGGIPQFTIWIAETSNLADPSSGWSDFKFYEAPTDSPLYQTMLRPTLNETSDGKSLLVTVDATLGGSGPSAFFNVTNFFPSPPPVAVCGTCSATAETGTSYSCALSASGGTAPYSYAITGGSLPPGLALDAGTGRITGTPTLKGSFSFTVTVTDAASSTDTVTCAIPVITVVAVSCGPLVPGTMGQPYSEPVPATGGTEPYHYVIISGSLPPGLTLDPETGIVSGTPTTAGVYSFLIGVADSAA